MVREGKFALVDGLEQGRLSAAVLAEQAVSSAVVDLDGGVVEEDPSVEDERRGDDLDVAGLLERGEHTGCDAVRQAMLVFLHGQLLDLLVEFEILGIVAVDRVCLGRSPGVGL